MTRILGIHGINNYQPGLAPADAADVLSRRWSDALCRNVNAEEPIDLRVAYYAHHLARDIAQSPDDPEYLDHDEQLLLLEWTRQLGAPSEVAQGTSMAPARLAADWIARHYGLDSRLARILVSRFCREVSAYFRDEQRRQAARTEVTRLLGEFAPQIMIAHSLGSVVGYEALWEEPQHSPHLLITLGSPLGMPDIVFDRLTPYPKHGKGHSPPGVHKWINISDAGDFIAIPRCLTDRFTGVTADLDTSIHPVGFHKATSYLACPATAAAVAAHQA